MNYEAYSSFEGVLSDRRIVTKRYVSANAETRHKQTKPHIMVGLQVIIEISTTNV